MNRLLKMIGFGLVLLQPMLAWTAVADSTSISNLMYSSNTSAIDKEQLMSIVLELPSKQIAQEIDATANRLQSLGSRSGSENNTAYLTEIVMLRGHQRNSSSAHEDLELVVKVYVAFNGRIAPIDLLLMLRDLDGMAKTLSTDGWINVIAIQKQVWQQRSEWDSRGDNR